MSPRRLQIYEPPSVRTLFIPLLFHNIAKYVSTIKPPRTIVVQCQANTMSKPHHEQLLTHQNMHQSHVLTAFDRTRRVVTCFQNIPRAGEV
jgi:hypothetical protein